MAEDDETKELPGEATVERLAQEVARWINDGPAEGRETLREFAVAVIRDEVQIVNTVDAARPAAVAPFSFFGIGIPLLLGGAALLFIFPPIGLVFFGTAVLMIAAGIVTVLFSRRRAR